MNIAIAGAALVVVYLVVDYNSYKEISWKEFYSDFLEAGLVS